MSTAFLHYVLQHFRQLYGLPEHLPLHYGAAGAGLVVKASGTSFFEQGKPYPQPPVWKEWKGKQVPFFFADGTDADIISATEAGVQVNYDVLASAFYLLSGWQEYYSEERDQFGRFPFRASVQARYDFVMLPVVNYYFDILKTALEMSLQQKLTVKLWPEPFVTLITHDVDRLGNGWKVLGHEALKRKDYQTFFKLFSRKLLRKDVFDNLEDVVQLVRQYGGKPTCFFLCDTKKYQGHPNADYDVTAPKYRQLLKRISENSAETALHGSFETALSTERLQQDLAKLNVPVQGNRFHYLCFEPRESPQVLEQAGLLYDSTLGFAEHIGFRHSYCHPFRLFDFRNQRPHRFVELPLHLMDTTLHHSRYMNLKPHEVLPAVAPLVEEVRKFNGCFTVLWHNEHFANERLQGKQVFEQLMQHLNQLGSGYRTAEEAATSVSSSFSLQ